MNTFCSGLVGRHDFAAFSSAGRSAEDTVRTVRECTVTRSGVNIILRITADGFLYNMVRIITGTAVGVSFGKIPPDATRDIINSKNRALAGDTAPPQGLFLEEIYY